MKKIFIYLIIISVIALFILISCKDELAEVVEEEAKTEEEEEVNGTEESTEPESNGRDEVSLEGESQWQWQNPLPDGYTLNSVWCSSSTDIFAVVEKGPIKHYD